MKMLEIGTSPSDIYLAYLSAAVLAPLTEELIFRGILQSWFRRVLLFNSLKRPTNPAEDAAAVESIEPASDSHSQKPLIPAAQRRLPIIFTSLVFATVHFQQMPAPIGIFFLSLVLGTLYERTESLVPSIVLHALFNGFNTTLFLAATLGPMAQPHAPVKSPKKPAGVAIVTDTTPPTLIRHPSPTSRSLPGVAQAVPTIRRPGISR
jgi:hypothetical protein